MCRIYTPCAARTHAVARRRRVSHRTPALRPHRTDQILMRVRRTHNREVKISAFSDPKKSGWGGPRRALHFCHSFRFGRPRRRWPKRRRRSAPTPNAFGLNRNASNMPSCGTPRCVEWRWPCTHALCRRRRSRRPRRRRHAPKRGRSRRLRAIPPHRMSSTGQKLLRAYITPGMSFRCREID